MQILCLKLLCKTVREKKSKQKIGVGWTFLYNRAGELPKWNGVFKTAGYWPHQFARVQTVSLFHNVSKILSGSDYSRSQLTVAYFPLHEGGGMTHFATPFTSNLVKNIF